eukprot:CAMPEP_0168405608 /NCGR_PEP_ID=MMETSP0228-20121227/25227_1 /TAXON_ID=133427 /ORGANISM="Protoceratium reticulatum, Strain CCCM 535 (=CCMP 1889)" /LENGTH=488 /DNA_ID=CAMNT_0008419237 /DNA_START=126 /DNA_END=1592 /DNA_ORIENTATION=-
MFYSPLAKGIERTATRLSVSEVVERIGFGKAQLLVLFTGGAVLFNRGVHLCLMAILTIPVAKDLNLTHNQEGMLPTGMFSGMFLGTLASGYLGDRIGRRLPVCTSSIAVVLIGCCSAMCPGFRMLLFSRFLLGFAMAFGDVPVTALFSEISPARWRIPMRAFAEAFFDLGYTYAATLSAWSDPYLRELTWRRLMLLASIPPGAMGLLAAVFLPESPVYLASVGNRQEAVRVFGVFRRLNGVPDVQVDYAPQPCEKQVEAVKFSERLALVFGARMHRTTLTLAYIAFVLNIFYYGGMYVQPQVMTKGKGLAPGWEIVIGGPFDMLGICVATAIAQMVRRKAALAFALGAGACSSFAFGFAGAAGDRSVFMEVIYQFGVFGFYWVPAVGFIVFAQLAVESFPTVASTTGGSIAFCAGRCGAMAAPMLFENLRAATGQWNFFCYLSAAFSVVGVMLLMSELTVTDPTREDSFETAPDRRMPLADAEVGKGH